MSANLAPILPRISPNDRLGWSLFGSFLIHMVVILGVSFAMPRLRALEGLPALEITLVQTSSENAPRGAKFLANASQEGGGESERDDIARNPLPVREVSDRHRDLTLYQSPPQPEVRSPREVADLMTQRDARRIKRPEPQPERKQRQAQPPSPGLGDLDERARLNAELARNWQEFQKMPRRKYLNARTQEYKYAAYMDAWRAKVERIGNLNYPEEARRRSISGNLVLDVALNPDGSVNAVSVLRSSGHRLLDDAAARIVELAAPFAPFPPELRAEYDIVHITRTWKFNEVLGTH